MEKGRAGFEARGREYGLLRLAAMSSGPRLRVLLTVPRMESTSGPYREMMGIARHLPRPEFDLTICSLRRSGFAETSEILRGFGVNSFVAEYRPRGHSWGHLTRLPHALRGQRIIEARGPFDIQHSLDFSSFPAEALLARKARRDFLFNQGDMNETGRALMLRWKIGLACGVIAISRSVAELLRRVGAPAEKIHQVYLGIDLSGFAPSRSRPPGALLSVGQIIPRKRHEDAIRALAVLSEDLPGLTLRIAGPLVNRTYHAGLQDLARQLGVAGQVEFLGLRKDVPELMKQSTALIHCAGSEAFGWVVVEAMAAGLPVVASRVGGPSEVIEDGKTGVLVSLGDVPGYSQALRGLLGDPEGARRLAENARRRVEEHFSAQVMARRMGEIYRRIASRRRVEDETASRSRPRA